MIEAMAEALPENCQMRPRGISRNNPSHKRRDIPTTIAAAESAES
jgi:hypothetical protein